MPRIVVSSCSMRSRLMPEKAAVYMAACETATAILIYQVCGVQTVEELMMLSLLTLMLAIQVVSLSYL